MDEQETVAEFIATHDLEGEPEYRVLDLASEVGELAKNVVDSGNYGASPDRLNIESDELGDVLFSVLAVAEAFDMDASVALDEALAKYQQRLDRSGTPSSGE